MSTILCKPRTPRKPKIYTVKTIDTRSHGFNVGIATDFKSPDMALWVGHIGYWAEKNLASNKHIHDGLVWCYDTLDALCDIFPYYSRRQIETIIDNSIKEGLVTRGNYNRTSYDRTGWYALTPKAYFYFQHLLTDKYLKRLYLSISQICEMDFTEYVNGFPRSVTTIPDTDPDPDPVIKTTNCKNPSSSFLFSETLDKSILQQKLEHDQRTDQEFMKDIKEHVDKHSNKKFAYMQRAQAALRLLEKLKLENEIFYLPGKTPTQTVFDQKTIDEMLHNELIKSYQEYLKQFLNDRDVLKLEVAIGKQPLSFDEWCKNKKTKIIKSTYNTMINALA